MVSLFVARGGGVSTPVGIVVFAVMLFVVVPLAMRYRELMKDAQHETRREEAEFQRRAERRRGMERPTSEADRRRRRNGPE